MKKAEEQRKKANERSRKNENDDSVAAEQRRVYHNLIMNKELSKFRARRLLLNAPFSGRFQR
jgi:hypothetical protein